MQFLRMRCNLENIQVTQCALRAMYILRIWKSSEERKRDGSGFIYVKYAVAHILCEYC